MTTSIAGRTGQETVSTQTTSSTDGNKTTVVETTTIDRIEGSVLTDVQFIPFMREIAIEFVSYSLRPEREHEFYFDDKNVSLLVGRPNIIVLDTNKAFKNFMKSPPERISLVGSNAKVFLAETNKSTGNTTLYVSEFENPETNVRAGNTVTGLSSGLIGNVVSYKHQSGIARANSNTTHILLALDADKTTENVYVGNVITILTGASAGESANIVAYNITTQSANVSPAFSALDANSRYTIGDYRSPYSSNTKQKHYSTEKGFICGTLHIPDPSANSIYRFRTGERTFRILDNPRNDISDYTSRAEYNFNAYGLLLDKTQKINRTVITNTTITTTESVSGVPPKVRLIVNDARQVIDPIAQSFAVDGDQYPEGIFVSSIDVFFKNKGDYLPIEMQIRPMVEGAPSSTEILPYASTILMPNEVNVSELPNTSNSLTKTKFTFLSPIYLAPDNDYAFVLLTNDYGYDIYVSEVGEVQIGTSRKVSKQPFSGSMFKSQAAKTFTPLQDEDIMFVINKCVFANTGFVTFSEEKKNFNQIPFSANANNYIANVEFDTFQVHSDAVELPGTKITYNYKTTANGTDTLDSSYVEFKPERNVTVTERKKLFGPEISTKSFYMQLQLVTANPDVSPIVFHNRQNIIPQKMLINNMGVTNSLITIANTGSGYTNGNTTLTFSGTSGSGAAGYIRANASTGAIEDVIMTAPGSGYFDNITCSISSTDGTGASILVAGESGISGGPGRARYISKTVKLLDGFDAGDLRIYLTATKPRNSYIDVYYKVRNSLDPDPIGEKNWVHMSQRGNEFIYSQNQEAIEYEFRPSLSSNNITYSTNTTTYKTFNEFKIKIVLASESTLPLDIPKLYDVRVIALPEDRF